MWEIGNYRAIKNKFKLLIKKNVHRICWPLYDFFTRNHYLEQKNINLDLCNPKQKRVLISYIPIPNYNSFKIAHAQITHVNQIIYSFIKRNYCVDVCYVNDIASYNRLENKNYDIILGFGKVFKLACKDNQKALKINFITENDPIIVQKKYQERLDYFKSRHPNIKTKSSIPRIGFYDCEQFDCENRAIIMTSGYNWDNFSSYFHHRYKIYCNAIFNLNYNFNKNQTIQHIKKSKNNFLWFGSTGIIHKGLDIVIDTFRNMPNLTLNCYGISTSEISLFNKLKAPNIVNRGKINVMADNFITDIVECHNFCILNSCSEGMSTAIATCMGHGIIPIISKECGFDKTPCIIELEDYKIETLEAIIIKVQAMTEVDILEMRHQCYLYARENFSLKQFTKSFDSILDEILHN